MKAKKDMDVLTDCLLSGKPVPPGVAYGVISLLAHAGSAVICGDTKTLKDELIIFGVLTGDGTDLNYIDDSDIEGGCN
jgi:hypothetical protein